ncbi:MAG: DUF5668 domain-containing protein [Dehalococcoidia bacterium]|jgi:hypothetical protein|nr:DUF5668 domain-containing protein [Dehalococcoidia bacterium]
MRRNGGSSVVGLILIAIGVVFLLDTLDVLSNDILGTYWPVILIVAGGSSWITQGRVPGLGNLLVMTLGVLFLVENLADNVSFGDLWPVLLIVIGFNIVVGRFKGRKNSR